MSKKFAHVNICGKNLQQAGDGYCKWILADNVYGYCLYLHINGTDTCIIISVSMDTRTRYTLI